MTAKRKSEEEITAAQQHEEKMHNKCKDAMSFIHKRAGIAFDAWRERMRSLAIEPMKHLEKVENNTARPWILVLHASAEAKSNLFQSKTYLRVNAIGDYRWDTPWDLKTYLENNWCTSVRLVTRSAHKDHLLPRSFDELVDLCIVGVQFTIFHQYHDWPSNYSGGGGSSERKPPHVVNLGALGTINEALLERINYQAQTAVWHDLSNGKDYATQRYGWVAAVALNEHEKKEHAVIVQLQETLSALVKSRVVDDNHPEVIEGLNRQALLIETSKKEKHS